MIPRHLHATLRQAVGQYPVTTLTGPRQSGKTTLLRAAFPHFDYVSLEAPDERAFALEDPRGFLGRFSGPTILDEAQRAPDLFSYIQVLADEDPIPGRFVLSGSQNFLLMAGVSQSLAGRVRVAHLMPFSMRELARPDGGAPGSGRWAEHAWRGHFPRIHDRQLEPGEWLAGYHQTYLERDVRELTQVGDLERFNRFVMLCAGRAGQLLNLASLANDCGIAADTVRRWLSVLETGFVTFRLLPYHRNYNRRLTRSPKLYFVDTGLLCWLLGIRDPGQLASHPLRGSVFENLIVAEALKAAYHAGEVPRLYFWRDHRGNEIDLLMERGVRPHIVEIKSGATVNADHFKAFRYWRSIGGDEGFCTLVYGGDSTTRREGVDVLAWLDWPAVAAHSPTT